MRGTFIFGFLDSESLTAPVLDPTIGQFLLRTKVFDIAIGNYVSVKEVELTSISKKTHPESFYDKGALNSMVNTDGFYTAKDPSQIVL